MEGAVSSAATTGLIDTHCHLDVAAFAADRAAVLARTRAAGVSDLVVPGIKLETLPALATLCSDDPGLHPALGLHPVYLAEHGPGDVEALAALVASVRPVAIGEVGLDYFVEGLDRDGQQRLFEAQVRLAREAGLPLLLHVRKAHDTVLATLRRLRFDQGGIAHAFNGSEQQARQYLDLGFFLGFGGVATYDRARRVRRLAATLPLEALVLETDAPDLAPAAHHGERNSPEYLPEVLAVLAELRGEAPEALAAATSANARAVLRL